MKILHTADWQLGKPFAYIGETDNQALVRKARIEAIEKIGKIASEELVEAVLVAGDLFDSPSAKAAVVSSSLSAIGKFPCPVYVIPGNHDHGGPGSIWTQAFFLREKDNLAPNLVVCQNAEPVTTEGFVLLPCPLTRRAEASDTTEWLRNKAVYTGAGGSLPRIVLAHGSVQDFSSGSADAEDDGRALNRIDLERIPWEEIDYAALGDWHGTKQVHEKAWYSGTPEYDRFPKGGNYAAGQVLVVELERGKAPKVVPCPTGRLVWHQYLWEFHDDRDFKRLSDWVDSTFGKRTQEDLLKLELHGALGLESSKRLEELLETLRARLLQLKLLDNTMLAPTDEEMTALMDDVNNPLIARVSTLLHDSITGKPEEADTARLALRDLYLMRNRLD
jgi:DNA repair exonuclease SbcCD nuclease subunit